MGPRLFEAFCKFLSSFNNFFFKKNFLLIYENQIFSDNLNNAADLLA